VSGSRFDAGGHRRASPLPPCPAAAPPAAPVVNGRRLDADQLGDASADLVVQLEAG